MNTVLTKKIIPPLIPYIAVSIGLLVFHNAWLAMLAYHAGMAAVLLSSKTPLSIRRFFHVKNYRIIFISALAGACGGILLYVLWPFLSVPDDINSYIVGIGLNDETWPLFLAYFILVNPLIEEYYWRGYLASGTRRLTVNDLLFSGYHLIVLGGQMETIWLAAVFIGLAAGGWLWRQLNRINGGLLASVVSHMAGDISVMLVIYFMSVK
ncbi:type II CAAX prenyl endopeptidase Rce1 family protein [Chloroflexota bacterium]